MRKKEWGFRLDTEYCKLSKMLDTLTWRSINNFPITIEDIDIANGLLSKGNYVGHCFINIFKYGWSTHILKRFHRLKLLQFYFPDVATLATVPQNKRSTIDALEHTFKVLNECDQKFPLDITMKVAALFHDTGKKITYEKSRDFYGHEEESNTIFLNFIKNSFLLDKYQIKKVSMMILYHMIPLQFQRTPNWTQQTIDKWKNQLGEYAQPIIDFAIMDKKSNIGYVSPLLLALKEEMK